MITTGSTVALEGLAAGLPVAVLPRQRGEVYRRAGIVADSLQPCDVMAVWRRYEDPGFAIGILKFLENATGATSCGRADIAVAAIERLARSRADALMARSGAAARGGSRFSCRVQQTARRWMR